jgi:hypothetical protein
MSHSLQAVREVLAKADLPAGSRRRRVRGIAESACRARNRRLESTLCESGFFGDIQEAKRPLED